MSVLLCAATGMEVSPTVQMMAKQNFSGKVDLLITGVGLMAATYALTKQIAQKKPAIIVQAGISGCLDEALSLGEVVVVKNEAIGDMGVMENDSFKTLFELNLIQKDEQPWQNGKLVNTHNNLLFLTGLKQVQAVSVHEITTNEKRIQYYKESLKAQIEHMEGAALHFVGLMEGIPFLQIRCISNLVSVRDKTKWKLDESITNLNNELQKIINELIKE
ncbi:MAG: futalosine hydrolase [Flavisolibacter sp.]|nr:futalosine hydrolase [Flavisolibacter sp.]